MTPFQIILASVATLSLATIAVSGVAIVSILRTQRAAAPQQALMQERLGIYEELMKNIIRLNRRAVELDDEDALVGAHERLVLNQESELEPYLDDLTETFHRSFYLLDEQVRDAVSEYVDYVGSYHESGPHVGQLLSLGGNVVQAMRKDLGLSDIFSEDHGL